MLEIDEAIGQVENLYRAVTGKQFKEADIAYDPMSGPTRARSWTPPLSLFESSADVLVCADLPGVTRDRIKVTVDQGVLVIDGERTIPPAGDYRPRAVAEQPFGPFHRAILLPGGLKTSEMNAQLKDGVLEIRIPRHGDSGAKTVPVS